MEKVILKNFKAIIGNTTNITESVKKRRMKKAFEKGLVFSNVAIDNFDKVLESARDIYGNEVERLNATFYQNMTMVDSFSEEEKEILQAIHYLSTYGEIDELKNDGQVFSLNQQQLKEEITDLFTYIKVITREELRDLILKEVTKNVALTNATINEMIELTSYYAFDFENEVEIVKNRQFKNFLLLRYNIVPKNVDEFMRYLISNVTGEPNVYKTKKYVSRLESVLCGSTSKENKFVEKVVRTYIINYGYRNLGVSSNRYRKIWLMLRKHTNLQKEINKILRIAKRYAEPKKIPFIERALNCPLEEFSDGVKTLNNFALIKLLNVLSYRLYNPERNLEVIRIRNGFTYTLENRSYNTKDYNDKTKAIIRQLKENLGNKFKDKLIMLPKEIELTVPVNENQFVGKYIPFGSYIPNVENMVVGLTWNYNSDIDLHSTSTTGYKIGYCDSKDGFSGDMTGVNQDGFASEFIRVENAIENGEVANFYAHLFASRDVTDKNYLQLIIGKANELEYGMMIEKKDVIVNIPFDVAKDFSQNTSLGYANKQRFYFGGTQTSRGKEINFHHLNLTHRVTLRELFNVLGATVVENAPKEIVDYDFSLSALTREKLLDILV